MSSNESSFSINVTAASGENYAGSFTIRKRLSHMQALRRDELRRELLGSKPETAPEPMQRNAYILSTCAAFVVKGPSWWNENSNGVDLLDDEPVAAVFDEIMKVTAQLATDLENRAKKAAEALKA
jgi:hypothetical protein